MNAELIKLITNDHQTHFGAVYHPDKPGSKLGVVLVHGMTGRFIGEVESALPPVLAEAGYTCLVANNRGNDLRGAATELFAGCLADIHAAIDEMERRGFNQIALLGHSKGGVKVAYYLARTHDARVTKLGLLSPATSVHFIQHFIGVIKPGCTIEELIAEAKGYVEAGKADYMYTFAEWPFMLSAGTIWDHMNIESDDVLENLKSINVPVLGMCGELEVEWCVVVSTLHKNPPKGYTTAIVPGADHVYTGREVELGNVVVDWLNKKYI
jgi:pimeloyl-ACP methyl ester carboxylesterase